MDWRLKQKIERWSKIDSFVLWLEDALDRIINADQYSKLNRRIK